jgi:hypothetical protein
LREYTGELISQLAYECQEISLQITLGDFPNEL